MSRKRNLAAAAAISAAAGFLILQTVTAPAPNSAPAALESETVIIEEPPAVEESVPEQCAYVWAYHDAPDLSQKLDAAVKTLHPNASGRVQFFGEDCVYADGRSTFSAIETDFYVRVPAGDLTDKEALGNWMAQAMPLITEIPREEIEGNYGFVEFWFEQTEAGQVIARVPIQKYMDEARDKTGAELFRLFSAAP
ncbi:MAG: hypothetical protein LDL50_02270 [Chloroflexi bacterium]|nr:hypothetical protein [Chloroflexota bacterium]MCA2000464.1 hypothetical protein [Chloroflexota bacterium]